MRWRRNHAVVIRARRCGNCQSGQVRSYPGAASATWPEPSRTSSRSLPFCDAPHRVAPCSGLVIRRRLGAGGMGVVYEAFDRDKQMSLALKTLRRPSPDAILRLKNEFRALQDIQHRNLVDLGELFHDDGVWFFTMELVHGTAL